MSTYQERLHEAIWVAHTLFQKGLVTGSTGNISFKYQDVIYISKSGSCFGRIDEDSFAVMDEHGTVLKGKPSKEYPLHMNLYELNKSTEFIVHTHSLNITAISCKKEVENEIESLFCYTPYLKMLTNGKIKCVNYESPGSKELFETFKNSLDVEHRVYVLRNHGVIIASENAYRAFDILEEFEMSAKLHFLMRTNGGAEFQSVHK